MVDSSDTKFELNFTEIPSVIFDFKHESQQTDEGT